jgi:hypothetical protein
MPSITLTDKDGLKLTITTLNMKPDDDDHFQEIAQRVLKVWRQSKRYLDEAYGVVRLNDKRVSDRSRWNEIDPLAKAYFGRTLSAMSANERSTVRLVLMKTLNGLKQDQAINVNPGDDGAAGFVKSTVFTGQLPDNPVTKFRTMQQQGIKASMAPPSWSGDEFKKELISSRGPINIHPDWVDPRRMKNYTDHACVTLIHEATHRYADTWDYCYFEHGGGSPKEPERGRFDATDPENKFAHHGPMDQMTRHFLGNADSYGYFAFKVGTQ